MEGLSEGYTINKIFNDFFSESPYPHQFDAIESLLEGKSTVLRAPCGSGKTEVCYAAFILGEDKLPNRLIYSLPNRALVNEIAERISKNLRKINSNHAVSPQHGANSKDPFFRSEIIVATIDQTIGAYCCTPLSLPTYLGNIPAGAAVSSFHCFDEVHTYNRYLGLQSALVLIERSNALGIPFLVMSATLPNSFIEWFKNKFEKDTIKIVEGNDNSVKVRKQRQVKIHWKGKYLEIEDLLKSAEKADKIMVVCNTVERAQKIYRIIYENLHKKNFYTFLLHSRFLNKDRNCILEKMLNIFREKETKACLVTTQVCEAGLNISCDLLLTELAPADSLVQRIGRCARKGGKGEVFVFDVENPAPYDKKEMIDSRKYISEKLDSQQIGWRQELEFVNAVLDEKMRDIITDERRRHAILKSLGNAAFLGSKKDVEKNVRELLKANITIHNDPEKLSYTKLMNLPWLDIDVRVLKKHLVGRARFWHVAFINDEGGFPDFKIESETKDILPYEYYIVHPEYVNYTTTFGLLFGERGNSFVSLDEKLKKESNREYKDEKWIKHARNSVRAFEERVKNKEHYSLKLLSELLGKDLKTVEGLVELCIALHDTGKLNLDWQHKAHAGKEPLAHFSSPFKPPLPPHATISAYAMSELISSLVGNDNYAIAFELAIAHHHHTRAENVPSYVLGWQELYNKLLTEISNKFQLSTTSKIMDRAEGTSKLDISFPDFERKKQYTIYCIVSRLIRLSDIESFEVNSNA